MKHSYRWPQFLLIGLLTSALSLALVAQDEEDEEEIYELSPFTIAEEEDVGYLATTTLAGTRLNTPLRDVGSAISVLTEELFDDTGATDAGDDPPIFPQCGGRRCLWQFLGPLV